MRIIKVSATDSTNLYLKRLLLEDPGLEDTVVVADTQYEGRGQAGTTWLSEPGKNLTFSLLKTYNGLLVKDQFLISMATSLALVGALKKNGIKNLAIKWPNDILSGTSKIGGVLIENGLKGTSIRYSIIGIGLNVNQESFDGLKHVSSIKLLLGRQLELGALLDTILEELAFYFKELHHSYHEKLVDPYHRLLFRKDQTSLFEVHGEVKTGIIRGVDASGQLLVENAAGGIIPYGLKELRMLY